MPARSPLDLFVYTERRLLLKGSNVAVHIADRGTCLLLLLLLLLCSRYWREITRRRYSPE